MRLSSLIPAFTAIASFVIPIAAVQAATTLRFVLTGDLNANWTGPASPRPQFIEGLPKESAFAADFSGGIGTFTLVSWVDSQGGGIDLLGRGPLFRSTGPQIFTGSTADPTFRIGVYRLTRFSPSDPGDGTLTISAIPEAASWAMMIAGFGLVGSALRRRADHPLIGRGRSVAARPALTAPTSLCAG